MTIRFAMQRDGAVEREFYEFVGIGGPKAGHVDDSVRNAYPEEYAAFRKSLEPKPEAPAEVPAEVVTEEVK